MKNKKPFWAFNPVQGNSDEGELMLYGVISSESWYGDELTPKQFKSDLDALGEIKTLNIHINSPGGDVFAGSAIYSMLKRCKAEKIVYIDGLAASMASVVAMAGDLIIMPKNAMLMVHNPWGICAGFAAEMRDYAELLDKIAVSMSTAYSDKTGKTDEDIRSVMAAETWFTAEEAVEAGWADKLEDTKRVAACMSGDLFYFGEVAVDPSKFKAFPKGKIELNEPAIGGIVTNITALCASDFGTAAKQSADVIKSIIHPPEPPKTMGEIPLDIYKAKIQMNERRFRHYEK